MHEVPRVLMHFTLPQRSAETPAEELVFGVHPQSGDLLIQVATAGRQLYFPIPAELGLELAREIMKAYAPKLIEILDRAAQRSQLQLVHGGAGPEAA